MATGRRHPTGKTGSHFFGSRRADLEPLPMAGPEGVDPNLWAHAVVADRGVAGWARLTLGEVVRAHPRTALGLGLGSGSGLVALLVKVVGVG